MKKQNFTPKLKKILTSQEDKQAQNQFYKDQVKSFIQLRSYLPINPINIPSRKHKKFDKIEEIKDIQQLFQQKQQLRKSQSNSKLHTSELHEYIEVHTIGEEQEERVKQEDKPHLHPFHYHNKTKQVLNLMRNSHHILSPVVNKIKPQQNLMESLNFKQFSRLMKTVFTLKGNKEINSKKRTQSEFTNQNN